MTELSRDAFDELVRGLCVHPEMYFGAGRALPEVVSYLVGYHEGAYGDSYWDDAEGPLRGFNGFITNRFGYARNTAWDAVIIQEFAEMDRERALNAFLALYAEFASQDADHGG